MPDDSTKSKLINSFKRAALYPGSFSPITFGHLNVIKQASQLADILYIGVGVNPHKVNPLFSPEERIKMIEDDIKSQLAPEFKKTNNPCQIKVISYEGATVRHMKTIDASILIRGIRDGLDLADEERQRLTNAKLFGKGFVQAYLPPTDVNLIGVSSSITRDLCLLREDNLLDEYVTKKTKAKLVKRMEEQGLRA
jgi:pantetheine-phosphate adenylyltransferase